MIVRVAEEPRLGLVDEDIKFCLSLIAVKNGLIERDLAVGARHLNWSGVT